MHRCAWRIFCPGSSILSTCCATRSHEQQRHLFWLHDKWGCGGKSTLAAFLCERLDALILTADDEADVLDPIQRVAVTSLRTSSSESGGGVFL